MFLSFSFSVSLSCSSWVTWFTVEAVDVDVRFAATGQEHYCLYYLLFCHCSAVACGYFQKFPFRLYIFELDLLDHVGFLTWSDLILDIFSPSTILSDSYLEFSGLSLLYCNIYEWLHLAHISTRIACYNQDFGGNEQVLMPWLYKINFQVCNSRRIKSLSYR